MFRLRHHFIFRLPSKTPRVFRVKISELYTEKKNTVTVYGWFCLVLSRMFGYAEQKLLGRSQKKFWIFLNVIPAIENFQVSIKMVI
jgi:hypothetical protein